MEKRKNELDQLKRDIKILLESVILTFEFAETVDWFNDNLFDGTMTLHEAKSLIRVIGGMEANHAVCLVIQSCLARILNRCQILGLEAMAYEARTLSCRLTEQSVDQGNATPPNYLAVKN